MGSLDGILQFLHSCEKTIATLRQGLDVARRIGIVIQRTANLLDANIQAALKIDKEFLAPNLVLDFLSRNRFTGPDCQNCQHLERLRLQF